MSYIISFIIFIVICLILVAIEIFGELLPFKADNQTVTIVVLLLIGVILVVIWKVMPK